MSIWTDWLKKLKKLRRSRNKGSALSPRRRPSLNLENLEDRLVLTTKLYIDFGFLLPSSGQAMSVNDPTTGPSLLNLVGNNTGPDWTSGTAALPANADLNLKPLSVDYDGNGTANLDDLIKLKNDVLPLVRRAYEPFAVDVQIVTSATIADVKATLDLNKGDPTGQFDAYVYVGTLTSSLSAHPGHSVALTTGLFGKSAGADRVAGTNTRDEVALLTADEIVASTAGAVGTDAWRQALAGNLANVIAHEAGHTFGLSHTAGSTSGASANDILLATGDVMSSDAPPSIDQTFSRFLLMRNDLTGT